MTRGVLVAVVLSGIAWSAEAGEPARARTSPPQTASTREAASTQDFRSRGPDTFDVAVRSGEGRGLTIYRYNRATKTAVLVERLAELDVPRRTTGFSSVSDTKIVLTPEGYKKPTPPQPPGGDGLTWALPEAERQAALKAVQALEPGAKVMSIGQLQATTP
ncbi:hypothetical protein F0U62_28735 [Cystobacter fuscus]|uniref:hypothetical protein n=1 Tax=Cystobacter fuscus TaxID=43 RepID=UPI002B285F02|nr:hypothetical protein F0U62_28735 [Cystobacter fuscus]